VGLGNCAPEDFVFLGLFFWGRQWWSSFGNGG
jgi:hypothetical protein